MILSRNFEYCDYSNLSRVGVTIPLEERAIYEYIFLAMGLIYLDWASTAPPDPEILDRTREVSGRYFGNPSSIHRAGREAEKILAHSRQLLSTALSCREDEIIFTSGGTEANNMVLFSLLGRGSGKKVILSGIEHASLYQPAKRLKALDYSISIVEAEKTGFIDPARIEEKLDEQTALVMLMLVNNETGAVQPITEVAESLSSYRSKTGRRIYLHSDAVQGFGKIPFNPVEAGVDSASFSAHKIGGPRGVGALYVRRGISYDFLYSGGGQERGRRPGTENSAGIFGFALAGEKTVQNLKTELETATRRMKTLISGLQDIEGAVLIPQSRAEGGDFRFSPYILSVAFAPVPGEVLTRVMEEEGFLISTGAACSSKKKNRFRIMENMGISKDLAISAIRISQGRDTRLEDLERFTAVLRQKIPELRKIAG